MDNPRLNQAASQPSPKAVVELTHPPTPLGIHPADGTTVLCCLRDETTTVPKADTEQHRRCVEAMQRVAAEILTQNPLRL